MDTDNDPRKKVLIIDDDPAVLKLLAEILDNDFLVETKDETKVGIQSLHTNKPELILLDINLGEAHGIEIAKMIKLDPENNDIPIIFISGLNSIQDKDACYEAGAVDFISKPFSNKEVLHKVNLHIDFKIEKEEQNKVIDETRQMAFTSMAQTGEIGQVLHFMRDSFVCNTFDIIADRILEYTESCQLKAAIIIKSEPPLYYSHEGEIARLDKEILARLSILERIIDFEKRTLYNFEHISVLIKNMPLDDEGLYGRIKDNICLIMEAADAKIVGIKNEKSLQKHHNSITQAIDSSKDTLKEIESSFQENAKKNAEIMFQLRNKIEESFLLLGLSETQESEILDIIDTVETDSKALYDSGLQIEERIIYLADSFSDLSDKKSA